MNVIILKFKPESAGKYCTAFTVLEMLIVIAVLAIIAGLFLPASRHEQPAKRIKCVSNLKQVGLAFRIWEGDNGDSNHYPMSFYTNAAGQQLFANAALAYRYFQVMSNELYNPQILICPDDKTHTAATNFDTDFNGSHVSFFVGLEADEEFPQLLLAGDMNLTNGLPLRNGIMKLTPKNSPSWTDERHHGQGNVGLADGSVQQFSTSALRAAIQHDKITERLLMPDAGATK